jgi:prevent-host-death family protein
MKHWPAKNAKRWSVQDAKARFSELLDASVNDGPQIITKRGAETAVLVPVEEWRRLTEGASRKAAFDLLVNDPRRFELDLPARGELFGMRDPIDFG